MDSTVERNSVAIRSDSLAAKLEHLGAFIIRYGLVVILLWIGSLKFTMYEADGIKGLVANSPLMSWMLSAFNIYTVSAIIGAAEIIFGLLIAARAFAPKLSVVGSIGAIVMFLTTMSFLLTTPGIWQSGYGFPFLSPMPGQFIVKDLILLGAAIWTAGEALLAAQRET